MNEIDLFGEPAPAPSLVELAAAINAEHAAAERAARKAIEHAKAAGEKLLLAKAQVEHGQWLPWLSVHCPELADRTARAYMQLARNWTTLESKTATVAVLTINEALKLLTAPEAEPEPFPPLTAESPETTAEHETVGLLCVDSNPCVTRLSRPAEPSVWTDPVITRLNSDPWKELPIEERDRRERIWGTKEYYEQCRAGFFIQLNNLISGSSVVRTGKQVEQLTNYVGEWNAFAYLYHHTRKDVVDSLKALLENLPHLIAHVEQGL